MGDLAAVRVAVKRSEAVLRASFIAIEMCGQRHAVLDHSVNKEMT